jgi:hypothetical protein
MDNVTAAEKLCTNPSCTIVSAVGYAAGSDVPVSSKTYALVGLASQSGMLQTPGDVAGLIRYSTAARTTKNHPVYLFNYMHGAQGTTATPDVIGSTWKSVLQTYASAWISGFSDGSVTYNRAGPNGASATGSLIENYLTHRDFPR